MFLSWKGDHAPRHVHVCRGCRFVVKWDLENWRPMRGRASDELLAILRGLMREKRL